MESNCRYCNQPAIVATSNTTGCCDGARFVGGYINHIKDMSSVPCGDIVRKQQERLFQQYVRVHGLDACNELMKTKAGIDIVTRLFGGMFNEIANKEKDRIETLLTDNHQRVRTFASCLWSILQPTEVGEYTRNPPDGGVGSLTDRLAWSLGRWDNDFVNDFVSDTLRGLVCKQIPNAKGIYSLNADYYKDIYETVLLGPVVFVSASWNPQTYVGEKIADPTVLDAMFEFEKYIAFTKDYHHIYLENLHLVKVENGVQYVAFVTGS